MPSNYPANLDALANPTATDTLASVPHDAQHANANDAIEAVQAVLGTNPQGTHATVKARIAAAESSTGGGYPETAKVFVREKAGAPGTYTARTNTGSLLYEGASADAAIQEGVDHANVNGGGTVLIAEGTYPIGTPIIGRPVTDVATATVSDRRYPVRIAGMGAMQTPPFGTGYSAGTVLKWTGGNTGETAVLDLSDDCHSYVVTNLVVDADMKAKDGIRIAGAHARIHDMIVTRPRADGAGTGIRVWNGPDDNADRYVGVKIHNVMIRGNGQSWGVRAETRPGYETVRKATDGGIANIRVLQCGAGQMFIGAAGWIINGENHFTSTATAQRGVVVASSFTRIAGCYFDVVGEAPNLEIASNQVSVMGCHFMGDNKTGAGTAEGSPLSIIKVNSGNNHHFSGNGFYIEPGQKVKHCIEYASTTANSVYIVGNHGAAGMTTAGFTNLTSSAGVREVSHNFL